MLHWSWHTRSEPLKANAAIAWQGSAVKLLERLSYLPETWPRWRICAHAQGLIVFGVINVLPWVEGTTYLGQAEEALSLWLPVHRSPDAPLDLIAQAMVQRFKKEPLLLWPEPACVIPLNHQYPLTQDIIDHVQHQWQEDGLCANSNL